MSRHGPRRVLALALVALACCLATSAVVGCSVSVQQHPVVLGPGRLRQPTALPPVTGDTANRIEVFLVHRNQLVGVYRPAPPAGQSLHEALKALTEPLTAGEQAAGYRSALPSGTGRLSAQVRAGIAYVKVPSGFAHLGVSEQVLAVGQITGTLTAVEGVAAVQLTHDGHDVDIPVGGGQLVPGPVTATDYAQVTAPQPTATPRSTTSPGSPSTDRSDSGSRG